MFVINGGAKRERCTLYTSCVHSTHQFTATQYWTQLKPFIEVFIMRFRYIFSAPSNCSHVPNFHLLIFLFCYGNAVYWPRVLLKNNGIEHTKALLFSSILLFSISLHCSTTIYKLTYCVQLPSMDKKRLNSLFAHRNFQ